MNLRLSGCQKDVVGLDRGYMGWVNLLLSSRQKVFDVEELLKWGWVILRLCRCLKKGTLVRVRMTVGLACH